MVRQSGEHSAWAVRSTPGSRQQHGAANGPHHQAATVPTRCRRTPSVNTGTIVRLIRDRGFGFIRMENGEEIFFHATGMSTFPFDSLEEGLAVSFEIADDVRGRGQRAVNVELVG